MNFLSLILKNVLRHRLRTLLTMAGISIGIATIIMLGAVADGVTNTFSDITGAGEADFIVVQANAADLVFSNVDEEYLEVLSQHPHIRAVTGTLVGMAQMPNTPFFMLFGLEEDSDLITSGAIIQGTKFSPGSREVVLGKIAATGLGLRVGDTVHFFGQEHLVVGIYETGSNVQDGGAAMDLKSLQTLLNKPGKITMISVWTKPGTDINLLTQDLDEMYHNQLITIKSAEEINRVDQGADLIKAASWMMSSLAVVIGGIGVMNTMIISVYDRIREIGVLKALGWKRRSIIKMILGEAALVGLGAVVIGSLLGVAVLQIAAQAPAVKSLLAPQYSLALWLRATLVALLVTLLGGLYPAWSAANLRPIEALRYE